MAGMSGVTGAAAVIAEALDRMKAAERTLICRPEDEEKARALATGLPWLKVQTTELCPVGKAFLIDEAALMDWLEVADRPGRFEDTA
jgi:hypothetical protein